MKTLRNNKYDAGRELDRAGCAMRLAFICGLTAVLLGLRSVDPVSVGKWLPLRPSCGAVSGLPCLFCGMTRALHALLNGDFTSAIYLNWLALPFLALIGSLTGFFLVEVALRRIVVEWSAITSINGRKLTIIGLSLFLLWMLQVYLAVSQHKHELLNRRGPLYALFVR